MQTILIEIFDQDHPDPDSLPVIDPQGLAENLAEDFNEQVHIRAEVQETGASYDFYPDFETYQFLEEKYDPVKRKKTEKGKIDMSGKDSGFITDEREFYKSEGFSVGFFLSRNFVPCIEANEEFVKKIRKISYEFMGAINITFKTPAFFDGKVDFDYTNNDCPRYKDIPKEASEFLDVCFTKYNLIRPINRGKIPSSGDVICVNNRGTRRFFLITTFGFVELKMFA
jgi:hypothetical protein